MMKNLARTLLLLAAVGFVTACIPTTIQPEQLVVNMSFDEAFDTVSMTINTQPYPSNKGGWVLMNSDQVGGIIVAEMNYSTINWLTGARTVFVERVSVAFNALGENQTAINVSGSSGDDAEKLMVAIVQDLTN